MANFLLCVSRAVESRTAADTAMKLMLAAAKNAMNIKEFVSNVNEATMECEGSINISTHHSAKGREYAVVFVVDCVRDVFPKKMDGVVDYETELRVAYVAITRSLGKSVVGGCGDKLTKNLIYISVTGQLNIMSHGAIRSKVFDDLVAQRSDLCEDIRAVDLTVCRLYKTTIFKNENISHTDQNDHIMRIIDVHYKGE